MHCDTTKIPMGDFKNGGSKSVRIYDEVGHGTWVDILVLPIFDNSFPSIRQRNLQRRKKQATMRMKKMKRIKERSNQIKEMVAIWTSIDGCRYLLDYLRGHRQIQGNFWKFQVYLKEFFLNRLILSDTNGRSK